MAAVNIFIFVFVIFFSVPKVFLDDMGYYVSVELALIPICAGSVIQPAWILSVAHCLHDGRGFTFSPSYLTVSKADTNGQDLNRRQIKSFILHEEYLHSKPLWNDLALLKLTEPFDSNSVIKITDLFTKAMSKNCIIMNQIFNEYGLTDGIMVQQKVRPINGEMCSTRFWEWAHDRLSICVLGKDLKFCRAKVDFGGPLVCDNYHVGIATWAPTICKVNRPILYTSVDMYYEWIMEQISKNMSQANSLNNNLYLNISTCLLIHIFNKYFMI